MSDLDEVKAMLLKAAGLDDPAAMKSQGLCAACREPALPKCYSEAGRREYIISGMCEKCFDACTQEQP